MKFCPDCGGTLTKAEVDGVSRVQCARDHCQFVQWSNPVPVVMALVQYKNKFVIAHNTLWPKGLYSFITGYLDQFEKPEQAVLREVREELNLDGTLGRFLGHHMFLDKNQLIIAYEVFAIGELKLNHELDEYLMLSHDEFSRYDFNPLYISQDVVNQWRNG